MKSGRKSVGPSGSAVRTKHTLSYQLREVIEARGLTAYAAARLADLDPGVVSRFLTGERDIRLGTADRLASALGLRLVEVGRPGRARPVRGPVSSVSGSL